LPFEDSAAAPLAEVNFWLILSEDAPAS